MSPPSQSFMSLVLGNVYSLQDMSTISNLKWESSFFLLTKLKSSQPLMILLFSRPWLLHGSQLYYISYCITYTPHKRVCTWIFWRLDEETVLTSEISLLGSSLSDWVTFRFILRSASSMTTCITENHPTRIFPDSLMFCLPCVCTCVTYKAWRDENRSCSRQNLCNTWSNILAFRHSPTVWSTIFCTSPLSPQRRAPQQAPPPTHPQSPSPPPAPLFSFEPGISSHHKHESESSQIIGEAPKFWSKSYKSGNSPIRIFYLLHTKISVQGPLFG